jgi:acyl-CoA synthetase (AMP-forming)/AMP-acid ligase II
MAILLAKVYLNVSRAIDGGIPVAVEYCWDGNVKTTSPQETFCERVIASANAHCDNIAMTLIEPHGKETMTFGSMLSQTRSIAYRLSEEGIAFVERVALLAENHPNWAIAYLGIIYRGAVVTPLDPSATTQA